MKIIKNAKKILSEKLPESFASDDEYNEAMQKIDQLMSTGSENVTKDELAEIRHLALLAQAYEQKIYPIPAPSTFADIIEMKMYDLKLKQTELAKKLKISDAKLSLILSGKQKPDILFLKAVHYELKIDANILVEAI